MPVRVLAVEPGIHLDGESRKVGLGDVEAAIACRLAEASEKPETPAW